MKCQLMSRNSRFYDYSVLASPLQGVRIGTGLGTLRSSTPSAGHTSIIFAFKVRAAKHCATGHSFETPVLQDLLHKLVVLQNAGFFL